MTHMAIDDPLRVKRQSQRWIITNGGKVGGTAGFTVGAANNVGRMATVAASQSGAKLVVPIDNLKVGWQITGFGALGQIQSVGGAVTLDLELRKLGIAAADITDASVTTMTQLAVTAQTAVGPSNAIKTLTTAEVVGNGQIFYLIVTVTTAASTDVDLMGLFVDVTEY